MNFLQNPYLTQSSLELSGAVRSGKPYRFHGTLKLPHHGRLERREFAQVNQHQLEQNWFDVILEFDFNFDKLFNKILARVEHAHIIERDLANLFELVD